MYLFFDTETTGLPGNWKAPITDLNNWPRLVQLAYLVYDSQGKKIDEGDFIIKPEGFSIPADASRIHGITTERALREGKSLSEVLKQFHVLISQSEFLVAHNMSFDEKIVGAEFLRLRMQNSIPVKKKICTMESSINYCAISGPYGYKWPKLSELYYKLFKSNFEEAHNAMIDIRATSKCFWELVRHGIIRLNQTSSFNLIDESKNLIADEEANKWNDQIKILIDEYISLKQKSISYSNRWNELNFSGPGAEIEEQGEIILEMEKIEYLSVVLDSEIDSVKCLLEEKGITEESYPDIFRGKELFQHEVDSIKYCSKCLTEIRTTDVYCNDCGNKLKPSKIDTLSLNAVYQSKKELFYNTCMEYAKDALKMKSYYEAIEYFNKALEICIDKKPFNLCEIFNGVGLAYYGLGKFIESERSLKNSIEVFPNFSSPYENLVATYFSMGEYDKLFDTCDLIAPNFPISPQVWYYVAHANDNLKSYNIARVAYQNAIEGGLKECVNDLSKLLKKMNNDGDM